EVIGRWPLRQRIAAKHRGFFLPDMQPQDHKLTRLKERKTLSVDRDENEGSHVLALFKNLRDPHLFEPGPSWVFFLICESRIPLYLFRARRLFEHCLE